MHIRTHVHLYLLWVTGVEGNLDWGAKNWPILPLSHAGVYVYIMTPCKLTIICKGMLMFYHIAGCTVYVVGYITFESL